MSDPKGNLRANLADPAAEAGRSPFQQLDRGCLREGCKADLVVFDYYDMTSPATIMEPDLYPTGIEYVLVNGRFTVDGGEPTGELPGEVLDRRDRDATARGEGE